MKHDFSRSPFLSDPCATPSGHPPLQLGASLLPRFYVLWGRGQFVCPSLLHERRAQCMASTHFKKWAVKHKDVWIFNYGSELSVHCLFSKWCSAFVTYHRKGERTRDGAGGEVHGGKHNQSVAANVCLKGLAVECGCKCSGTLSPLNSHPQLNHLPSTLYSHFG